VNGKPRSRTARPVVAVDCCCGLSLLLLLLMVAEPQPLHRPEPETVRHPL
jgi:hypothetical protein